MKKLVNVLKNNLKEWSLNPPNWFNEIDSQVILSINKGLKIIESPTPSKKGFPFDLPAVEQITKLIPSQKFVHQSLKFFSRYSGENPLTIDLKNLNNVLEDILSEDTICLVRLLKTLNTKFIRLRQILSNHESAAKQIRQQLILFIRQLKKHSKVYPKCKVIIKRIKKYWNVLFHGYDDKRIPLTNLEIERSFNRLKRRLRKRTGLNSRKNFFILEGEALLKIEPLLHEKGTSMTQSDFIHYYTLQRGSITSKIFQRRCKEAGFKKTQLKKSLIKKYTANQASMALKKLKRCFELS